MKKFAPLFFAAAACFGALGVAHAAGTQAPAAIVTNAVANAVANVAATPAASVMAQNAGSVSHHAQAVTATHSAAAVQEPSADAADAEVSPGYYALMLLALGLVGFAAKRQSATPKFAIK